MCAYINGEILMKTQENEAKKVDGETSIENLGNATGNTRK